MNLPDILHTFEQTVSAWEGITAAPHRFGGVEFTLGGVEIGHLHRHGMVDIPLTRRLRVALLAEQAAEPHHLLPETGWISYYLRHERDLAGALALMQLSYLHKRARRHPDAVNAALEALPFGPAVRQAFAGHRADADADPTA
ncbi:MAG: DUF5519 family protein [Anaerolineae bacterium]|nr:DUF5519 family protein [Anaerolineae bacterium]